MGVDQITSMTLQALLAVLLALGITGYLRREEQWRGFPVWKVGILAWGIACVAWGTLLMILGLGEVIELESWIVPSSFLLVGKGLILILIGRTLMGFGPY